MITKELIKAALVRAARTFAQGALAAIGSEALISNVNWLTVLSTGAMAAIVSLLMSVAGLPEVPKRKDPAELALDEIINETEDAK